MAKLLTFIIASGKVQYKHDGSESVGDVIPVRLTHNKYRIMSGMENMYVEITPVNDNKPSLVKAGPLLVWKGTPF